LLILGSTGSIGVNTIIIAKKFNIDIEVLSAGRNITLLNTQIKELKPKVVVIQEACDIDKVEHSNVYVGQKGITKAIEESSSNLVVNAIVGFAGLNATLSAIKAKKRIALANKESLVVAGAFIDVSNIVPIDSEHFGLWYLLNNRKIDRLIITASGGAFRDWKIEEIKNATLQETQKHPNWSMGEKITIDSATMVNKLFEVLEAKWLFNTTNIDAIIETKSIIHSLIDFKDGSSTAHIAATSMQLPIAFALDQKMDEKILNHIDLLKIGKLEFKEIEIERYPVWQIKDELLQKPYLGVVVNAANEAAISLFKDKKIGFLQISEFIIKAFKKFNHIKIKNIEDVFKIDNDVRGWINDRESKSKL